MKSIYKISLVSLTVLSLIACGGGSAENKELAAKKAELQKLKEEQQALAPKIAKLEEEISKLDTSAARPEKEKLVAIAPLQPGKFAHYIDLQGRIDAENIAYVSPRGGPGQVKELYVKIGDNVRKGQLLLKLDDAVARRQLDQLETNLSFAKDLAQRQQNLWNQNIGTEVQLLTAKNNVESLEKQIALAKDQVAFANVYAEMDGVIDQVNVKVGEIFGSSPQIRIVNNTSLKVVTQVPENYQGKVNKGSNVLIVLPEANNDSLNAKVTVAGSLIDPISRSFFIEAKIPAARKGLRPNQIAMVKILDYTTNNAITVPVSTIQSDDKGKYVFLAVKENGKLVARRRSITVGELYGDKIEVKSGLQPGEQLVTEGFQGLYEGQLLTTAVK
jgi:membrane fusion protein (multidrug efflux system)